MFRSDAADRTLPPTERHRRDARARGEIVYSAELTSAIVLFSASFAVWWLGPAWSIQLARFMQRSLVASPASPTITELIREADDVLAGILFPRSTLVVLCASLTNLVQTGWVCNLSSLVPRLRLSALVSSERMGETILSLARLLLLVAVMWLFFNNCNSQFLLGGLGDPATYVNSLVPLAGELSIQLYTLGDYAFRFWRHEQSLKMTTEERRREQQDDEVDPEFKRRREKIHR